MTSRPSARLTVSRTSDTDIRQRQVIVSVDDGPKTALAFGESVTIDLAPGDHTLKANNTLIWKRVPFVVADGGHARFRVANRASRLTLGFLALMGVAPLYLTVERDETPTA